MKRLYDVRVRRRGGNTNITVRVEASSESHAQRIAIRLAIQDRDTASKPAMWLVVSTKEVQICKQPI